MRKSEVRKSESPEDSLKSKVESPKSEVKPKDESKKRKADSEQVQIDFGEIENTSLPVGQADGFDIPISEIEKKSKVGNLKSEEGNTSAISIPQSEIENKSEIEHPKSEIETLQTANLKLPTENTMEVHHHPEVEKKGFKEYILEGLMIFLAVTMGFFAESLREHITEKNNANDLAHSFYDELKSDSAAADLADRNWHRKDSALTYVKKYFEADSSLVNCSKAFSVSFYYAFLINTPSRFEPKTVILEQLKNSGSLRYFKSTELQKLTGELSVAIANVRYRNEVDAQFIYVYITPFSIKYNDPLWYDNINPSGTSPYVAIPDYEKSRNVIPFHLNNPANFNRNEALNMIGIFSLTTRSTHLSQYKKYQGLNHNLLDELRKEYGIK